MAQRAIERLDAELAGKLVLLLERDEASALLGTLDQLPSAAPAVVTAREALRSALAP